MSSSTWEEETATADLDSSVAELTSEECVVTLLKVLDNIITETSYNLKTRKLKLTNKVFSKRVARHAGGVDFLQACGFLPNGSDRNILILVQQYERKWWLWKCRSTLHDHAKYSLELNKILPNPPRPNRDDELEQHPANPNAQKGANEALAEKARIVEEQARLQAEKKATAKAEEEAGILEQERLQSETDAKAIIVEQARLKAENETNAKAEEEARVTEQARLKAEIQAKVLEDAQIAEKNQHKVAREAKAEEEARITTQAVANVDENVEKAKEERKPVEKPRWKAKEAKAKADERARQQTSSAKPTIVKTTESNRHSAEDALLMELMNKHASSSSTTEHATDNSEHELSQPDSGLLSAVSHFDDLSLHASVSIDKEKLEEDAPFPVAQDVAPSTAGGSVPPTDLPPTILVVETPENKLKRTSPPGEDLVIASYFSNKDMHHDEVSASTLKEESSTSSSSSSKSAIKGTSLSNSSLAPKPRRVFIPKLNGDTGIDETLEEQDEKEWNELVHTMEHQGLGNILAPCWGALAVVTTQTVWLGKGMDLMQTAAENDERFRRHLSCTIGAFGQKESFSWIPVETLTMIWKLVLADGDFKMNDVDIDDACQRLQKALIDIDMLAFKERNTTPVEAVLPCPIPVAWVRTSHEKLVRFGVSLPISKEKGNQWLETLADVLEKEQHMYYSRYALPSLLFAQPDNLTRVRAILKSKTFVQSRLDVLGTIRGTQQHVMDCQNYIQTLQQAARDREADEELSMKQATQKVWEAARQVALAAAQQTASCLYVSGQALRKNRDIGERNDVATALHNLGMAAGEWGDYEFEMQLYSKTLKLRRESGEHGNEAVADTLICMGACHQSRGNYSAAMSCYEEAQDMYRKTLGTKHVKVAKSLHNMGVIHCEQSEQNSAMKCFKSSLKLRQQQKGNAEYDEYMADTLCWIGKVYREQHFLDKAFKYFVTARIAKEDIFGKESLEVAEILHNIAVIHDDRGEYDRALDLYTKSLRVRRNVLGDDHDDVCEVMTCMGNAYVRMEDHRMALKVFEKALKMRTRLTPTTQADKSETLLLIYAHEDVLDALKHELNESNDPIKIRDKLAGHLQKIGYLYDSIDEYNKGLESFEKCLSIRKIIGEEAKTGQLLNAIGIAHAKRKKYEVAMTVFKEALEVRKRALGDSHIDVAETLHNMGNCAAKSGDYGDARVYYEESLRTKVSVLNGNHPSVAQTLHNMGNIMVEQGHIDAAMKLYTNALAARKASLGEDNLDVAFSLHCLGKMFMVKQQLNEAIKHLDASLHIKRLKLIKGHISIAETLEVLGTAYVDTGKEDEAALCFSGALRIYKSKLGNHLNTAVAMEALGSIYDNKKDYSHALEYFHKALKVRTKVFGSEDMTVASVHYRVGKIQRKVGSNHEALSSFQLATRLRKRHAGRNDLMIADILTDAGEVQLQVGQQQVAHKCYAEALRIRRYMLNSSDVAIGESLLRMGQAYRAEGELDKAIGSYEEGMGLLKEHAGENDATIANAYEYLGEAYKHRKDFAKAIEYYEKCISARKSFLGDENLPVAGASHELGVAYLENGSFAKAEDILRESVEIKVKLLGEDDLSIAESVVYLGRVCLKMESPDEALMYFEQARLIKQQHLGDGHLDCEEILCDIGAAHELNGEYNESLSCLNKYVHKRRAEVGDDEVVADIFHRVGTVQQALLDHTESIKSFTSALALYRTCLGGEHLSVAKTLHSLALVYETTGEYKEAMKFHKEAFRMRRTLLGSDHLQVATSLDSIAGLYLKESNTDKALQGLKEALRIRTVMYGCDDIEVGTTLFGMGIVFEKRHDLDKAMECYVASLLIRRTKLGESSIEVAQTLHNMGTLYAKRHDYTKALQRWRSALTAYHEAGLEDDQHIVAITIGNITMAEGIIKDQEMEKSADRKLD